MSEYLHTGAGQDIGGSLVARVLVTAGNDQISSMGGQAMSDRTAQAARPASHEGHLASHVQRRVRLLTGVVESHHWSSCGSSGRA
jgi:hypothetical protein